MHEDDFLFVKLGNHKPKCEPLVYKAPDEQTRERLRQIAEVVRQEFSAVRSGTDPTPLFDFVKELSAPLPEEKQTATSQQAAPSLFSPRFCYSYFARYSDSLLDISEDPYPDGYLARLAATGVDGVWLLATLHWLAPFPWDAKLSQDYEQRLNNLRQLVAQGPQARHWRIPLSQRTARDAADLLQGSSGYAGHCRG